MNEITKGLIQKDIFDFVILLIIVIGLIGFGMIMEIISRIKRKIDDRHKEEVENE